MRNVLVIGGSGALGRAVVAAFRGGWRTTSVDLVANADASESIAWTQLGSPSWGDQIALLRERLRGATFSSIVVTAGGWAGGGVGGDDASAAASAALVSSTEGMLRVCLQPALVAGALAPHHLAPGGLLLLTGSAAAVAPTPGMLGYGMAKAATHHLAVSLAAPGSGLPAGATVVAVAPTVIDTPANRAAMGGPGADTSSWTPPEHIAQAILGWTTQAAAAAAAGGGGGAAASATLTAASVPALPPSGALVFPVTTAGATAWRVERQLYAHGAPLA